MERWSKWLMTLLVVASPLGMMAEVGDTVSVTYSYWSSWAVTTEIEQDGVLYGANTWYAYVKSLSDSFESSSLVLRDSVEVVFGVERRVGITELRDSTSGTTVTRSHYDTIYVKRNLPVTEVSNGFLKNSPVESLTLPIGLGYPSYIELYKCFLGANQLREIKVKEGNTRFSSRDGLLCNLKGDSLLYVPNAYGTKYEVTIPQGIHVVADNAFYASRDVELDLVFRDSVSCAYLPDHRFLSVRFVNQLPPALPAGCPYIIYVPKGAYSAYHEKYNHNSYVIIEDGSGVERVFKNKFSMSSVYDVDNDGTMELVGYRYRGNGSGYIGNFITMRGREELRRDSVELDSSGRMDVGIDDVDGDLRYYTYYSESIGNNSPVYRDNICIYTPRIGEPADVSPHAPLYVDVDNDGLKDLVMAFPSQETRVLTRQPDGSYQDHLQYLTANPEEMIAGKADSSTPWDVAVLSEVQDMLRGGMFVYDTAKPLQCIDKAVDANGDGILDLIDTQAGGILYSYDDNKYYKQTSTEIVYPYDINGDGQADYVTYDGETLYYQLSTSTGRSEKTEFYKNKKIDQVLFRDFDHDGDIDILVFFCTAQYKGDSYFVFLRNNGDGTFRRKEQNYKSVMYTIMACRDYDADGCYELLVREHAGEVWDNKLMQVNSDFTITEQESLGNYTIVIGDFSNNGFTEFYSGNAQMGNSFDNPESGDRYGHLLSQTIQNTAPKKMLQPVAMLQPEIQRLKISWQRGEDAETSACDLTYELRIGTAPGLGDVMRAESLTDGRRRTIREGNQGTSLQTLFNAAALKPGKYYISVQAIDQGGLGGPFSEELVYTHELQAPKIYVSGSKIVTTDTLTVYVKNVLPGAEYQWAVSDGEMLGQAGGSAQYVFHESGDHEISLSMIVDGIAYKASRVKVYVDAIKDVDYARKTPLFDFNQDGWIESYMYNGVYGNTYYKGNERGEEEQLLLSTFADINTGMQSVIDYNHDGYPDFFNSGCSKGNVFLNYGEQDYDFDYKTIDMTLPDYNSTWKLGVLNIDLNNDGWPDANDKNMMSTTDGVNWTERLYNWDDGNFVGFYDINRDGFPDLVYYRENPQYGEDGKRLSTGLKFYVRHKDNTAELNYGDEKELFCIPDSIPTYDIQYHIADFDNDGCYDLAFYSYKYVDIYHESDHALTIIKGKKDECSSDIALRLYDVYGLSIPVDIDNDGYLDFPYINRNTHGHCMLKMKPGFGYEWLSSSVEGSEMIPMGSNGDYWLGDRVIKTNILNQSPSAPAAVTVKQTQDGMLISWADAQDDHTPAMQMRYNVSVKRKGRTGADSFVISPMNGLKDEAAIVPGYQYKKSTQMLVPSTVLTAGETYEVQVQAIDLWGAHSPMTKPVELTMTNDGYIMAEDRVAVDVETLVALHATKADSYSIDLGEDGEMVEEQGEGRYIVKWHTPGIKEFSITAGTTKIASVMNVVERLDVSFDMPELVLAGVPLSVKVSDEMARQVGNVGFRCSGAYVNYVPGSQTAILMFPSVGTYELTSYFDDDVRGNMLTKTIEVTNTMPEAKIRRVTVDAANHYVVSWNEWPSYIEKVVVMRESIHGYVVAVDTVAASSLKWVDASSNALVAANRYCIKLLTTSGYAGEISLPHNPMHVMMNTSSIGGYNLVWNAYEGLDVGTYNIWRGIDDTEMELIDYVSGHQLSYTDLDIPAGASLVRYIVSFTPVEEYFKSRSSNMRRAGEDVQDQVCSNIISTANSFGVIPAQQIAIVAMADEMKLTFDQPSVQLYSIVLPTFTTISGVSWSIVDGEDLATIDHRGLLTAYGESGSVTVRATTLDGTNLTAELTIPIEMAEALKGDVNRDKAVDVADVVQTVNYILGRTSDPIVKRRADLNGDGEISVGDLVDIVSIITGAYSTVNGSRSVEETFDDTLEGMPMAGGMGISLHNQREYTAFQLLITIPENVSRNQVEMMLGRKTDHVFSTNWLSDRDVIIVAYSMSRSAFTGNEGMLLQLLIDDEKLLGEEWMVSEIVFAQCDGRTAKFDPIVIGQKAGVGDITGSQLSDTRIFDLSGRRVESSNMKKGIYIKNGKLITVK